MKKSFLSLLFLNVVYLSFAQAAPAIKQFHPASDVQLGEPAFWVVQARYKIWESYNLSLHPPAGAQMEVESATYRRSNEDVIATYRIRIVPENLKMNGPPMVVLTGLRGESVALRTTPVKVASISGNSMDVRQPFPPRFKIAVSHTWRNLGLVTVWALGVLLLALVLNRIASGNPRNTLIRQLSEVMARIGTSRPPDTAWLCILLRSELLWGQSVQAATVTELVEKGKQTRQHELLSTALEELESARYSGIDAYDNDFLQRTVSAALVILNARPAHIRTSEQKQ